MVRRHSISEIQEFTRSQSVNYCFSPMLNDINTYETIFRVNQLMGVRSPATIKGAMEVMEVLGFKFENQHKIKPSRLEMQRKAIELAKIIGVLFTKKHLIDNAKNFSEYGFTFHNRNEENKLGWSWAGQCGGTIKCCAAVNITNEDVALR